LGNFEVQNFAHISRQLSHEEVEAKVGAAVGNAKGVEGFASQYADPWSFLLS
jgi:hypothetical protein